MSAALLDINVLIALAWPSHVHHAQAHDWFARHAREGWATCPLTQLGFVRISSNPRIIPEAVSPRQALEALRRMVGHEHHVFWPDAIPLDDESFPAALLMGHRQLTDAYLLALAIRKRGRLATVDESIRALLPAKDPRQRSIELIRART
ncbi:MAG: VapC toxin family PIN domain ribonuclease [Candidatus Sumerlaeota bacterium]|nr:VapC toxin family PIN domain ribonuclease [Candidatus Sumerlaeota bacterium]